MSYLPLSLRQASLALFLTVLSATPILAGDIVINNAYARSSGASAKSGAIFMEIMNLGEVDDRLIAAKTSVSKKAELHTHVETDDGIMQMREVKDGFVIPAGGMHNLARGSDHIMLMGLTGSMAQGDTFSVTLSFEKSDELVIDVPVDLERKATMKHHGSQMKAADE